MYTFFLFSLLSHSRKFAHANLPPRFSALGQCLVSLMVNLGLLPALTEIAQTKFKANDTQTHKSKLYNCLSRNKVLSSQYNISLQQTSPWDHEININSDPLEHFEFFYRILKKTFFKLVLVQSTLYTTEMIEVRPPLSKLNLMVKC